MDMVPGRDGGYDAAAVEAGAVPDAPDGAGAPGEAQAMEQRVGLAPRRWGRPLRVLLALAGAQACDRARTCLELAPGFAVVGVAPNGHRALALAAETEPDVAVVDADLPAGGLAVVPALRRRSPASVVVALASPSFGGDERPSFEVGMAQPGGTGADVYLGPGTPLVVLTDVLADLAVRLDQESRRPLRGQWPAHVPPPVARWAESVHGPELRLVRGVDHALGGVRNPGRAEMSRMGTRSSRPSIAEPRPARRRGRSRRWSAGIAAAAAAGSILSAGVAAAATGSLPVPAQALASRVLATVHVSVPNPDARPSGGDPGQAGGGRGHQDRRPNRDPGRARLLAPGAGSSSIGPSGLSSSGSPGPGGPVAGAAQGSGADGSSADSGGVAAAGPSSLQAPTAPAVPADHGATPAGTGQAPRPSPPGPGGAAGQGEAGSDPRGGSPSGTSPGTGVAAGDGHGSVGPPPGQADGSQADPQPGSSHGGGAANAGGSKASHAVPTGG
ncbi:MAG: response regulator transcription factor [Actinobacteria bacterium]|nr:MAG: response regulator transcription factor [Actinomycetota bacterium]